MDKESQQISQSLAGFIKNLAVPVTLSVFSGVVGVFTTLAVLRNDLEGTTNMVKEVRAEVIEGRADHAYIAVLKEQITIIRDDIKDIKTYLRVK